MSVALSCVWLVIACARTLAAVDATREDLAARVERWVVAAALGLALAAGMGAACTAAGRFTTAWVCATIDLLGLALWFTSRMRKRRHAVDAAPHTTTTAAATPADARRRGHGWIWLALALLAGLVLRSPPTASVLGGQDQGSYTLRAQHSLLTGALELHDELLEQAELAESADLLGLFPIEPAPARADVYEGGYRPGFYLRDRERGRVVPQFFALHPAGLQLAASVFGPDAPHRWMLPCALLALFAFGLAARRHLGNTWGALACLAFALAPLAVWTQRLTLSEGTTAMLVGAAWLAGIRCTQAMRGERLAALAWDRAALTLLALTTWCRGEGWVFGPVLALALWRRPTSLRARGDGAQIFVLLFAAGVAFHAEFSFPYVHDELLRRFEFARGLRPGHLQLAAAAAATLWFGVDRLCATRPGPTHAGPRPYLALALIAGLTHIALVWANPGTHGRLDPLPSAIGWPTLALAVGAALVALRHKHPFALTHHDRLLALLALCSLALYLPRGMPSAHLFYYGRYLVPVLLPTMVLLAVAGLRVLGRPILAGFGALALLGGLAWPLAYGGAWPMQERQGSEAALAWLAEQVPPNAIVIAGGEGWHRGFTDHQVATALMVRHGRTVLPYRNREAAIATTYALLGQAGSPGLAQGRPVYWLVNEASHHYTRENDGEVYAGADLLLPSELLAVKLTHLEFWSHRHTPSSTGVPTRRTRDGMRMSLVQMRRNTSQGDDLTMPSGPNCLPRKARWKQAKAMYGQGEVMIELDPGDAIENLGVDVHIGGKRRAFTAGDAIPRPRGTLGPFALIDDAQKIEIRGFPGKSASDACPHGRVRQIRVSGLPHAADDDVQATAHSFEPREDFGQAYKRSRWVAGRALNRFRPGPAAGREVHALSLRLRPNEALRFDPMFVPAGAGPYDLIATLTRTRLQPSARVEIWLDGQRVQSLDPPDVRAGSWQGPKLRWDAAHAWVKAELRLVDAGSEDFVDLRDLAFFELSEGVVPEIHVLD